MENNPPPPPLLPPPKSKREVVEVKVRMSSKMEERMRSLNWRSKDINSEIYHLTLSRNEGKEEEEEELTFKQIQV